MSTPNHTRNPTRSIFDNHTGGKVGEFLEDKIVADSDLSIVSAYFTIYAYDALAAQLDEIKSLRFLFGEPRFITSLDPERSDSKSFNIEDEGLVLAARLQQKAVARRCAEWISEKVEIRSIRQSNLLHGKLYHIQDGNLAHAILGSSNFTRRGLGLSSVANIELNLVVDSDRDRVELQEWFGAIWDDDKLVEDVKEKVLAYLKELYTDHAPEFIYFKTLYHIFAGFLTAQAQEADLFSQTSIANTKIWDALFGFQKDGARAAIHKINNYNGCILADSVGLGKTWTALAVIKYHELRNCRVLVLCPRKLRENWTVYLANNNSDLNPLLQDRFAYTVLSHTDLSRESGKVGDIDLATLNWGNYDLVVIDESHNFRNNTKGKRDEEGKKIRKSRYERLMEDIISSGSRTRVLLLSATPVNNNLKDLRNQIYFVTEGCDTEFSQSLGVSSIKSTLGNAQKAFMQWAEKNSRNKSGERDVPRLMNTLPSGFFTLLDALTIARSRKHIERHYEESLHEIGKFPERLSPESMYADIDTKGEFPGYGHLDGEISNYRLSLFNPTRYVLDEFKAKYAEKDSRNFTQANREILLIGMMKVNFLKRLESSVHSFAVTMTRTVEKIKDREERLRKFQKQQADKAAQADDADADLNNIEIDFISEEDASEDEDPDAYVGTKLSFYMGHLNIDKWLKDLAADRKQLATLAESAEKVNAERDAKLKKLQELIAAKVKNPTTNLDGELNRKVIVFCAFADTAAYLYDNLEDWARQELGVHIALVSGGTRPNRTTLGKADYNHILTHFAPRAKQRAKMASMSEKEEIDLLIATDCISEGQNLQDCDTLINYDIHWNPVRIIQRFGRIDRIGSRNGAIRLVNFWPTKDLEKYIRLKNRVEARMALVDITATAEDNILAPDRASDLTSDEQRRLIEEEMYYRDRQLLRLKEEILDLEEFNETVALSEFTLDDFRMELLGYIEANRAKLKEAPFGLYAVVPPAPAPSPIQPGVIYCLRQNTAEAGEGNARPAASDAVNPLHPYFLVYIYDDGEVRYNFTAPKQILDIFRNLCQGRAEPYSELCKLFNAETQDGTEMGRYNDLLCKAVRAIVNQFQSKNTGNLFAGRGGKLIDEHHLAHGDDDFELITWLIIKAEGEQND